jgi:hypothetical protein
MCAGSTLRAEGGGERIDSKTKHRRAAMDAARSND